MANLYIKTFGCQMNEYDSDKITDILDESHQLSIVNDPKKADVLLINTCSIRHKAQEKLFHQLGRWKNFKKENPNIIIGVGGCVASQEGTDILKRAPFVDIVFGPQTLHRLPDIIDKKRKTGKSVVDISFPEIEKFDNLVPAKNTKVTAYVSIMEGCSKYCSFCVVPYTRGEEISRDFDKILQEVYQLSQKGVREINLLGQNVNAYQGKMTDNTKADLSLLINYIATIPDIYRIRFTTSHPSEFSDRLAKTYDEEKKLVSHLHLPIQSGSDKILAQMKRGYDVSFYKKKIQQIRSYRQDISLSSDFIVGFPNETDKDFADTMNLIEDITFDKSFSFIYSARPGTPASEILDMIPMSVKKNRLAKLQNKLIQTAENISESMLSTTQKVLVEGISKRGNTYFGRTENNRVVNFIGDGSKVGNIVDIKITKNNTNSMSGQLV